MSRWPFVLYALTGFTGVLAEQGFEKYLSLLVGATAAASTVVIFAYFLGFALGSWAVGAMLRRGRIARPLLVYGVLEFLVGASAILFSFAFHPLVEVLAPLQSPHAAPLLKFVIRFVFGSVLVLPTAALMGASFPLIAQTIDRANDSHGESWIRAYSLNLGGAVVAAIAGGYLLLPAIGVRGALWLCFVICSVVFAGCLFAGRRIAAVAPVAHEPSQQGSPAGHDAWLLLMGAFASGLVFFALEVLWTHLIGTTIGTSVYAFSAMLATVLIGLLVGARRVHRQAQAKSVFQYSRLFFLSALLLVIQIRLWDYCQIAYLTPLPAFLRNFYGVEAFKLLVAAVMIVPAAAILGSIFPSLLRSPVFTAPGRSYLVGYLNTWNSLGCIVGAILGIFVLIPVVGTEHSLKLIVIAALALSLLFLWRESPRRKTVIETGVAVALVLIYTFVWKWDARLLTSGMNVYFGQRAEERVKETGPKRDMEMIYFHEDAQSGMTTVYEFTTPATGAKERILLTNGKFEGSDNLDNQGIAQIGFAAIPSLFNHDSGRALLIGLGTGHSAATLASIGYGEVDVAEFAPGIVEAARTRFGHLNQGVLSFPNVALHVEDGRNVLLTDPHRDYDLITVEITSIWFAGATNVYSREFYELAKKRLRPNGVLQQWIQLHHISPREIESVLATVRAVFPHVSLWYTGGQAMVVATAEPQIPREGREQELTARMGTLVHRDAGELERIAREMFRSRVIGPEAIDRLLASRSSVINTDHNRWIEYATPRWNWSEIDWVPRNLAYLREFENTPQLAVLP
jgi:spermidine synthase